MSFENACVNTTTAISRDKGASLAHFATLPEPFGATRPTSRAVRRLCIALAASTAMSYTLATPAFAQSAAPFASVQKNSDIYDVDLATGAINTSITDFAVGNDAGGISHKTYWLLGTATRDEYEYGLSVHPTTGRVTIGLGATTLTFPNSSNGAVSDQGNGARLLRQGTDYVLVTADGTRTLFPSNGTPGSFVATESVSPDGTRLTFTYVAPNNLPLDLRTPGAYYRLASVTNSSGFRINYRYAAQVISGFQSPAGWFTRTGVDITNLERNAASAVYSVSFAREGTLSNGIVVTESNGDVYRYGLLASGSISSITRPGESSPSIRFTYNNLGRVSAVDDGTGRTSYTYTDSGSTRTTRVTDPNGQVSVYTFEMPSQRILSARDPAGGLTSWTYDQLGRVTSITRPNGTVEQRAYDSRSNLTSTTLRPPAGSPETALSSTASFPCSTDATCDKPSWVRDARGNQTDYTYDPVTGNVTTVTLPPDASGVRAVARTEYATVAGVQKAVRTTFCLTGASCAGSASEVVTDITYGTNGWVSSVTERAGNNSVSATTAFGYDAVGNTVSVDGPLPGGADTSHFRYDARRRQTGVISPDPDGAGVLVRRAERTTYDSRGRAIQVELGTVSDPGDAAWNNFSSLQQTEVTYDAADRPLVETVKSGATVYSVLQNTYSGQRLSCQAVRMNAVTRTGLLPSACTAQTAGADGPDRIASFEYDAASRPIRVNRGVGTSSLASEQTTYNAAGNVTALVDGQGNQTSYEYDGFGQLRRTVFPDGSFEQLTRDANGNVTSRRLRDGNVIAYTVDARNRVTAVDLPQIATHEFDRFYTYNQAGNLTQARDSSGHFINIAVDALGRPVSEASNYSTRSFTYDAAGRRTSLQWQDGFSVTYDYFDTGEMRTIRENGSFALASFEYDNLGRRTRLVRGNGTQTNYTYNSGSELAQLRNDLPGTANDYTADFTYTTASQIKGRTQANSAFVWNGAAAIDRPYSVNNLNQYTLAGGVSFQYDGRGNLTRSGTTTFQYTAENRLAQGPGGYLAYDPLGRLYTENGSNILQYDGENLITEIVSNAIRRRYVHGPGADEPLVWYEGSGTNDRRWLVPDERGSVIAVTDQAGNVIGINRYDEFGIPAGSNLGRFQYTGQTWLASQGFYHYKARIYSPTLGRFLQTDPIGYEDGLNLYAYVGNDPINNIDPTGESVIVVTAPKLVPVAVKVVGSLISAIGSFFGIFGGSSAAAQLAAARGVVSGEQAARAINPEIIVTAPQQTFGAWNAAAAIAPSLPALTQVGSEIIVRGKRPSVLERIGNCALSQFGLDEVIDAGLVAAGQPIPGTKRFVTPGSSRGTSVAGLGANKVFGNARLPTRLPTLVGGPGTGRKLAIAGTKSLARFAGRAVPVVGLGLLAYDVGSIAACTIRGR